MLLLPMAEHQDRPTPEELARAAHDDVASILSRLPANGHDDYVTRVMDVYESAERQYRAALRAGAPKIGSSASTNA